MGGLALTQRELWNLIHLGVGVVFVHAAVEGVLSLWHTERFRRLVYGVIGLAVTAWLTVISGTWMVYPGYRARPPEGTTDLEAYPRSYLLADDSIAAWHNFGMEWKEHVAWMTPFLATAVAFVVIRYGRQIGQNQQLRQALLALFVVAFGAALVASGLGAFVSKVAPNLFLDLP